jgi:ABC-2 type transport system ATP-binding protein
LWAEASFRPRIDEFANWARSKAPTSPNTAHFEKTAARSGPSITAAGPQSSFTWRHHVLRTSAELNSSRPPSDSPSDAGRHAAAIEARSLRRTFKGGIEAVRDIDLTVSAGEVFGFLGPNGAGKTTTVRMLCTLLPPTAGSATVAGLDVVKDAAAVRRRIGVALQEIGLDPAQTGRELLELQSGLYGITGRRGRERAEELLELVGLTEAADRRTKTYSGGMKRRLDLASALVHSPSVLFLDEPTTGLDPASRLTIWDEVRRINESGTTVFLTTQYLEEADKLCNRVAIIDAGRIAIEGTPEQLKAEMGHDVVSVSLDGADPTATEAALTGLPGLERVVPEPDALALYVEDGANSIAEIVRRLDSDRIRVGAIAVARPSLDDVFLKATGRRLEGEETASPEEVASP